jgi:1-deoxyxylulose-5-phosphate synthase
MESVNLGRSGLRVSRLCFGTMIFGTQRSEEEARPVMDRAEELGMYFFDASDVYPVPPSPETWGLTEEIVGRWMKGKRDRFVLATKCVNRVGPGENDLGGSRKHIIEACEASLRRLQTDRIDLYYLHHSDTRAPVDETFEALDRLVQAALALEVIAGSRLAPITAFQPRYNLLHRPYERDLIPLARAKGIGVVPYNPLGAGMLTGKFKRGEEAPADSRFGQGQFGKMYQGRYWNDRMFAVVDAVTEVARQEGEGVTPAQVAVAWLLHQDGVTAPIVGASRPDQLADTAKAVDLKLSPESLAHLDEVSLPFR